MFSFLLMIGSVYLIIEGSKPRVVVIPSVTMSPTTQDLGELNRDQVVKVTFQISNTHSVPVTIGPITKGCSCSEATVVPETILPGEVSQLSLVWSLRNKRGRASEAVTFSYAGANGITGDLRGRVLATVNGVIDADREMLELSTASRVQTVNYYSKTARPFKITNASTSHDSIKASVGTDKRSIKVEFDPTVTGWNSGHLWLTAQTDQPDESEVKMWVRLSDSTTHVKE